MQWLKKYSMEIMLILLTGLIVNISTYLMMHGCVMTFNDTDDYMRLVRMRELLLTNDWSNNIIARSNYPLGGELHWSRLYDICWFPLIWLVKLFCADQERALAMAGFVITPIIGAVASIIFFKIMHYIFSERSAFIAAILFSAHPILRSSISFGRPDYHGFIILVMLVFVLSVCHIIANNFKNRQAYIFMGVSSAICVWASPETLIPLLTVELVLIAIGLVKNNQILHGLYAKNMIATICMITLIANDVSPRLLALLVTLLLLMLPYSTFSFKYLNDSLMKNWHMGVLLVTVIALPLLNQNIAYDKISIVHVALYMYSALFCSISRIYEAQKTRVVYMLAWGLLIALIYISMYPQFLYGMEANVDSYIKTIWLNHVSEMKSPYDSDLYLFFYGFAALNIAAIYAKISEMMSTNFRAHYLIWYCLIACTAIYTLCSHFAIRMLPYAVIFSLPLLVNMGMSDFTMQKVNSYVRIFLTALITVLLPITTSGFNNENDENEDKPYICTHLYNFIDNLSHNPVVIMAHTNDGPELLYRTKHCVIGCPYHRQTEGITRSYIALSAEFNDKHIMSILNKTRTSYIFVRKSQFKDVKTYCLGKILALHEADPSNYPLPKWIEFVKMPSDLQDFVIARYIPQKD